MDPPPQIDAGQNLDGKPQLTGNTQVNGDVLN